MKRLIACLAVFHAVAAPGLAASAPQAVPKAVIFLDAGHGGSDPGVREGDFVEADWSLALARDLAQRLKADGYAVVLSRDGAEGVSLQARVEAANAAGADVLLSLHANRAYHKEAAGPRFFVPAPGPVDLPEAPLWEQASRLQARASRELAESLAQAFDVRGARSVQTLKMALFRGALMPVCVAELGFVNTPEGLRRLSGATERQELLRRLAQGLKDFLSRRKEDHAP